MLQQREQLDTAKASFSLSFAHDDNEIREAQRLRYKVFAEELGATLTSSNEGIDRDMYDPYCQHLLVREQNSGEVVGTYRLLTPEMAKKIGGYYSEDEFDLTRLTHLRDNMVEVGRSCVHPNFRSGAVIGLLWAGVINFMETHGYEYVFGCASISMADGGHVAASVYNKLQIDSMSPIEWRVFPRCPLPIEALDGSLPTPLPPLLKGYMRLGGYICGAPAWDPDFNTADLLVMLPMSQMNTRYARHFLSK